MAIAKELFVSRLTFVHIQRSTIYSKQPDHDLGWLSEKRTKVRIHFIASSSEITVLECSLNDSEMQLK